MGINKEMFECLEEMFFEDMKKHPKKDAIPIDWLKNYIDKKNEELRHDESDDPSDVWEIVALETLFEEWEKENDKT